MKFVTILSLLAVDGVSGFVCNSPFRNSATSFSSLAVSSVSPEDALQRTKAQLENFKKKEKPQEKMEPALEELYNEFIAAPANALKAELKKRKLRVTGRKPELAKRLAEYELRMIVNEGREEDPNEAITPWEIEGDGDQKSVSSFCGIMLSKAASKAISSAKFDRPSPIQKTSIPRQINGESVILHAQTGSGKTLAYLLPITEQLWAEYNNGERDGKFGMILTPTRELAAQVAGIAAVLAPPGTVRMVSQPTNLMSKGAALRDRGEAENGGIFDDSDGKDHSDYRLFIGSAKVMMASLYGHDKMPASPTRKPDAMFLLKSTRWLVLDEVDRLLNVKKTRGSGPAAPASRTHEKPAAVVTAAVARMTLGRAQVVAASATGGRSLKRELSRVLGLPPTDCPAVVRGTDKEESAPLPEAGEHVNRAVTIPDSVKNYVTPVDSSSVGKLMTSAFFVIKGLNAKPGRRILVVLTRGCGLNTKNAVGALKHFRCEPEPQSLLDALEADGTDRMIEKHRQVTGAAGVGQSSYFSGETPDDDESGKGYLLITGEDTVRGLHLDGLDVVVVVGRANGPDEYMHIAGRTGRAGRPGKVINVLSHENTAAVKGWEKMLNVEFERLEIEDVSNLD